jgi:hypothetical protein
MRLTEFVTDQIWLKEYPIHYAGCDFNARMSVVRVSDSKLLLHSPCEIDEQTKQTISALGEVAYIVAPGSDIDFDWFLADRPPEIWADTLDQVLVRGNKYIWEVAFFHKPSRTLLLTDLIENITDQTPNTNWLLKLWWKAVFHMWNNPKPAPEYQLGWKDKAAARQSLQRILQWDFERIVLSHGDVIEKDAKATAREAWKVPLSEA